MAKNEFLFEKYLDYRLADLISKHSEGKPALVFCQTQKGTIGAAKQLCEDFYKLNYSFSENIQKQLIDISEKVKDKQLGGNNCLN
jgi:replicative superfamily II helicase